MAAGFLTPDARLRVFSDLGVVLPGGKLNAYVAGTPATRLNTYSDVALTTPNANPVVASAGGLFGPIYLSKGVAYKLVLTDSADVVVWSQDNVSVPADNTLAAGTGISLATVAGVTTITNTVAGVVASIGANDFRLTLESGVAVSATDQLAKATLYLTPVGNKGNRIDLYDAAGVPTTLVSAQVSIAVPAAASTRYDVFAYNNAGVVTLELLVTTRTDMTGLTQATTGTWTKTADLTRRYLGSFRTTTVAGQTEDSQQNRLVWNYYNRVSRPLLKLSVTASWAYTLAVIRQADFGTVGATNQVTVVVGVAEVLIDLVVTAAAKNAATDGTRMTLQVGIGEDSTTTFATGLTGGAIGPGTTTGAVGSLGTGTARLEKMPAVGYHVYSWNEWSQANGGTTWYGTPAGDSGPAGSANGLSGSIQG